MLDRTPKAHVERQALRINPAKTCQPIGAMYAALGIHSCLPHSHGSQGCCAYHRSHLTRHYKEPVMAATSSFTEGSSVFGGSGNLRQALNTIFTTYNPDVVAVNTTCLSETIGDDLTSIVNKAFDDKLIPEGKRVIYANTPSYVGSHVTGFANMVKAMVKLLSETSGQSREQVNIIPGYVEPADMREINRLAHVMGLKTVMFPDTSDVLDAPQTGSHIMYPKGGVTVEAMSTTGDSKFTFALGSFASEDAAIELNNKCDVDFEVLDLPVGISATDRYIQALRDFAHADVPDLITDERGRLVDIMTDMNQYFYQKKVAIAGDPDQVIPLTEFMTNIGMKPVHVLTGTPGKKFDLRIKGIVKDVVPNANVKSFSDLFELHQWIKNEPVDLLIGNTYCKYIARAEDIPFIRYGWPILDRIGHSYFPTVGYMGGIRLLEKIIDVLLDRFDRDSSEERFELVM
jgi:nitrogenase molybdenum-iron protein beta chain